MGRNSRYVICSTCKSGPLGPRLCAANASIDFEVSNGDAATFGHYHSVMVTEAPSVAEIASAIGNPARTNILIALLAGCSLTAKELAHAAGVSPQTTSGHLVRLTDARLLIVTKQGRHSYFRLASPLVGNMLERIMAVASDGPQRYRPHWRGGDMLRTARTCYDHLAGPWGRHGRCLDAVWTHHADGGRGLGDPLRRALSVAVRNRRWAHRPGTPRLLPPLPRLERTAVASCGCCGSGADRPLLRTWMDPSNAGHPRRAYYGGRAARVCRDIWNRVRLPDPYGQRAAHAASRVEPTAELTSSRSGRDLAPGEETT
jgi:DNA-binding transcriptional ArsR family regulator